ncbi:helix-turn-helix domain-containing protein [Nocardia sp. NPDC006630]|uniref:PucR family transcriptional regulator n=1 Tax=Nocardia sp. NPDC006630 TaxID=3157181 RepID=UPI0033BE665C
MPTPTTAVPATAAPATVVTRTCLELTADVLERLLEVLAAVDSAVLAEHHTAVHAVTSALLGGQPATARTRSSGIEIEESYFVLALRIPPRPRSAAPAIDAAVLAQRTLRRLQSALAARSAGRALPMLSIEGGTVLLPESCTDPATLDDLVAGLSAATRAPLTATVMHAATQAIPAAADQAHELLDMVHRLQCEPGLYRFDDLAMEYQLTRPGPGREYLGALLDPLDEYPELLETLRRHLGNDLNRRRTARGLGVHTNTIDYRLKRIGQLTGFDPAQSAGLWYLRSALVARTYRNAEQHRYVEHTLT